jgi:thiol-disulfide isomerase/thioredoxin
MKFILSFFIMFVAMNAGATGSDCKPIGYKDFESKILKADEQEKNVIFFASWCSSCKEHMVKDYKNPIFVASYDSLPAATAAFNSLTEMKGKTCYFDLDNEIAEKMGAKGIPFLKTVAGSKL